MGNSQFATALTGREIAIIGMAGRFPGAMTVAQFWRNLCAGVESISFFSDQELLLAGLDPALLADPNYVRASAVLDDIECFDADFFDFLPHEAGQIDPQQRLFLECAWEALEDAAYDSQQHQGAIGVFAGVGSNAYLRDSLDVDRRLVGLMEDDQAAVDNEKDLFAAYISHKLNLQGPSLTVQSDCSTSLIATCLACQSLLSGESDTALVGGVSLRVPQKSGYLYQTGGVISPDGRCRAFDANGQGAGVGSGVGVVVLKRLKDALNDGAHIYALIKGAAINSDGLASSVEGQANVIRAAQQMAGVEPETIGYIEAHGTGTALEDSIEIAALRQVFQARTGRKQFCALGSVKTNVGHLDAAAGITGLIKTALAVQQGQLPPSLHFERPNPKIDFANSPFYVNTALKDWRATGTKRRAGVSAFGIGGTNVHVVLEEAPQAEPSGPSRPWELLALSARTPTALETATANLARFLKQHPEAALADVAYTSQVGRKAFAYRRVLVCRDREDALAALESSDVNRILTASYNGAERPVVFLFPGQGSQYVQMASELYEVEPFFREHVDHCAELLLPHLGLDIRNVLYPPEQSATQRAPGNEQITEHTAQRNTDNQHPPAGSRTDNGQLDETWITQPALFMIEYALAQLWMAWGVRPQAMIGHSVGEYVAACLAGVFSLESALALIAMRGRLMQELPGGSMLVIPLPKAEVQELLRSQVSLAAVNGSAQCVVAGPTEAITDLEQRLVERQITSRRLHTSHAFHSSMMDPMLESFVARVREVKLSAPSLPYVSNVTGGWITAAEATDPCYWASHLRQTVRFADGLDTLLQRRGAVLLEVGPGSTLSTFTRRHPQKTKEHIVLTSMRHPQNHQPDVACLLDALGRFWLAGGAPTWETLYTHMQRRRVPLPTYPFERQRCWVEGQRESLGPSSMAPDVLSEQFASFNSDT